MEYTDVLLIPIIIAIAEMLKKTGFNPKFIPVVNIVLGLIGGVIYLYPGDIKAGILKGLIMGLAASGFYSGYKNIKEAL
jgi:hypothetical protein